MSTYYSESKKAAVPIAEMATPHLKAAFRNLLKRLLLDETLDKPNDAATLVNLYTEIEKRWDEEHEALGALMLDAAEEADNGHW